MRILWRLKQAFVKEIIKEMPEPRPPYNTVSSIVRKLENEGVVGYESFGKTHRYFPKLKMATYRKWTLKQMINHYFPNDPKTLLSHFMEEENLTPQEVQDFLDKLNK